MAKNTLPVFKATIFSRGPVTLEGTIESLAQGTSVTFRYRKPSSSKWAIKTVAWKDLIALSGEQGKKGSVTYMSDRHVIDKVKGTVEADPKSGLMNLTTEDGETFYILPQYLDAVADDDIAVPSFYKTKKKAPVEDDDTPKKKKKAA